VKKKGTTKKSRLSSRRAYSKCKTDKNNRKRFWKLKEVI